MSWLDESEAGSSTLVVTNDTGQEQSVTVGCRTDEEVVFAETFSLPEDGIERWDDLPDKQFTVGLKLGDADSTEYEVTEPTRLGQFAARVTADGFDVSVSESAVPKAAGGSSTRSQQADSPHSKPETAADEIYCRSCGEPIKQYAEICPECGVRNVAYQPAPADNGSPNTGTQASTQRQEQSTGRSQTDSTQSPQQASRSEPSNSWATGIKLSIGLYGIALLLLVATIGAYRSGPANLGNMVYSLGLATILPVVQILAWVLLPISLYKDLQYVDFHTDEWPLYSRLYLTAAIVLPIFLQILGGIGLFISGGQFLGAIIPVVLIVLCVRYLRTRGRHVP